MINLFREIGKEALELVKKERDFGKKIVKINPLGQKTLKLDQDLENLVIKKLNSEKVGKLLVTEEGGEIELQGNDEGIFILDPLDGSNNFLRDVPVYALAISFSKTRSWNDVSHSYVIDLIKGDEFFAVHKKGAWMNDKKIFTSREGNIENCILEFDGSNKDYEKAFEILKKVKDIRRFGANALGLCYLANGAHHIFLNFKPISIVHTGALKIAEEAGAIITDFSGKPLDSRLSIKNSISFLCCANKNLYEKVFGIIKVKMKQDSLNFNLARPH
jgi:fructose-1,6-bisphosphatase/inositol monophosphatase family enzyme